MAVAGENFRSVHGIFISGDEGNDVALLSSATTALHRAAVKHEVANHHACRSLALRGFCLR
jgi:hypothetical protein